MKYPLIVNDSGDLGFVEDPRTLLRDVEADDVLSGGVEIFDSEGHVLVTRVVGREYQRNLFGGLLKFNGLSREVVVEDIPGSATQAGRLRRLIFSYLSAPQVSRQIPSLQGVSEQDSLPTLVEKLRLFLKKG